MKRIFALVLLLIAFVAAEEATISKKEMYNRARDVLKESLENNDTAKARTALEYLHANIGNGAPLTTFEEYLALVELGDYEEGLKYYFNGRRNHLDTTYTPETEYRISQKDGLSLYLYRNINSFDKGKADSLIANIDATNIPQKTKDLYASLLYCELILHSETYKRGERKVVFFQIYDTTAAEAFLTRTQSYISEAPDVEETRYLKNHVYPFVKKIIDQHREFRINPLKHKYYGGGLGFYYSRWIGFITGEATDDIKMDMGTYMLELELQFSRFNLGAFIAYGIDGERKYKNEKPFSSIDEDENGYSMGFTAGFNVFDSRFVKIVPFLGLGGTTVYPLDIEAKNHFLLGTNIDLRLFSTTPARLGAPAVALHLHLKYMAKFSSYNDTYYKKLNSDAEYYDRYEKIKAGGDYINHAFSIGLGLYLW